MHRIAPTGPRPSAASAVGDPIALRPAPQTVLAGLGLALLFLGPALGPGALINLDLVAHDHWPFPRSFWGIGPELPRAVPLELLLSALAWATSASTAVKLLFVCAIAGAHTGAVGLARRMGAGRLAAEVAGLLYASSPFLLTRIAVGHLTIVAAAAVAPWVVDTLVRPVARGAATSSPELRRSTLALAALSVMGFYGGLLAGAMWGAGLVAARQLPSIRLAGRALLLQLPWLLPGVILLSSGGDLVGGSAFPSGVDGALTVGALPAGNGFWQPLLQVGGATEAQVAICGVVLAALAIAGRSQLPADVRRPAELSTVAALAVVLWDASPVIDGAFDAVTGLGPLAALREPHRILPLALVWIAPTAVLGAARLATMVPSSWSRAAALLPTAVALVLAAPAVWGIDDRFRPVEFPADWDAARETIAEDPGTTLVLPWYRYLDIDAAEGRRALNPAIRWFGPDVITSSDLGLDQPSQETIDPREPSVTSLLGAMRTGGPVAARLSELGVTWVLILHEADYEGYLPLLRSPGLRPVLQSPALDLLRVETTAGPMVTADGRSVPFEDLPGPLVSVDTDDAIVWSRPHAPGWLRGLSPGSSTPDGLLAFDAGSGFIWFWPAVPVLVADLGAVFLVLTTLRRRNARNVHQTGPDPVE